MQNYFNEKNTIHESLDRQNCAVWYVRYENDGINFGIYLKHMRETTQISPLVDRTLYLYTLYHCVKYLMFDQ